MSSRVSPAARPPRPTISDSFRNLVETAKVLQGPGGCPWDRTQTVGSLLPHLLEEAWEVWCAGRSRRRAELREELGDVLYTVLFLALVAERRHWFDLDTLLNQTAEKMVRRHPHVFGRERARSPEEAYRFWQEEKRRERVRANRPRPSAKPVRLALAAVCELLRVYPEAAAEIQRIAGALLRTSGRSRRASGRSTRASDR